MYNAIKLDPKHWRYQLYLWSGKLKENNNIVIKTLIYGVRQSDNLVVSGLRRTAELCRNELMSMTLSYMIRTWTIVYRGSDSYKQTLRITDEFTSRFGEGSWVVSQTS